MTTTIWRRFGVQISAAPHQNRIRLLPSTPTCPPRSLARLRPCPGRAEEPAAVVAGARPAAGPPTGSGHVDIPWTFPRIVPLSPRTPDSRILFWTVSFQGPAWDGDGRPRGQANANLDPAAVGPATDARHFLRPTGVATTPHCTFVWSLDESVLPCPGTLRCSVVGGKQLL